MQIPIKTYFELVFCITVSQVPSKVGCCKIRQPTLWEGRAIKLGSIINTSKSRRTVKFQEANLLRGRVAEPKIPVEEGRYGGAAKSRVCSNGKATYVTSSPTEI
jgi:hypothetical protein